MRNTSLREISSYLRLINESRYLNFILEFNIQSVVEIPQLLREGLTLIIGKRMNDQLEAETIAKMMNFINEEQQQTVLHLKIADGIYIDKERGAIPVPIIIPKYPTQSVTDELINSHQAGVIQKITGCVLKEKPVRTEQTTHKEELSYQSRLIMEDFKIFPFDFQNEREIRLNINVSIIADTLKKLLKQGWMKHHG